MAGLHQSVPESIQAKLCDYELGLVSIEEFEQWVYAEKDLETVFRPDDYLELISLSYSRDEAPYQLHRILAPYTDFGEVQKRNLLPILESIVRCDAGTERALIETYDLYCAGYGFLDNLGMGFGHALSLRADGYSDGRLPERVEDIYPAAAEEANRVLRWLEEGQVILTGETNEIDSLSYVDHRSETERQPRTYLADGPSESLWVLLKRALGFG